MSKIVGLRGLDLDGLGDGAIVADAPRPALTLTGVLLIAGSIGLAGYIFWATIQKPKRKSSFVRNGRRRYRRRKKAAA